MNVGVSRGVGSSFFANEGEGKGEVDLGREPKERRVLRSGAGLGLTSRIGVSNFSAYRAARAGFGDFGVPVNERLWTSCFSALVTSPASGLTEGDGDDVNLAEATEEGWYRSDISEPTAGPGLLEFFLAAIPGIAMPPCPNTG